MNVVLFSWVSFCPAVAIVLFSNPSDKYLCTVLIAGTPSCGPLL